MSEAPGPHSTKTHDAASPDEPAHKVAHPWLALTATLIGLTIIVIDGSIAQLDRPTRERHRRLGNSGAARHPKNCLEDAAKPPEMR